MGEAHRTDDISEQGKKIQIDENLRQTLKRDGLSLESIPRPGQTVLLRSQVKRRSGLIWPELT